MALGKLSREQKLGIAQGRNQGNLGLPGRQRRDEFGRNPEFDQALESGISRQELGTAGVLPFLLNGQQVSSGKDFNRANLDDISRQFGATSFQRGQRLPGEISGADKIRRLRGTSADDPRRRGGNEFGGFGAGRQSSEFGGQTRGDDFSQLPTFKSRNPLRPGGFDSQDPDKLARQEIEQGFRKRRGEFDTSRGAAFGQFKESQAAFRGTNEERITQLEGAKQKLNDLRSTAQKNGKFAGFAGGSESNVQERLLLTLIQDLEAGKQPRTVNRTDDPFKPFFFSSDDEQIGALEKEIGDLLPGTGSVPTSIQNKVDDLRGQIEDIQNQRFGETEEGQQFGAQQSELDQKSQNIEETIRERSNEIGLSQAARQNFEQDFKQSETQQRSLEDEDMDLRRSQFIQQRIAEEERFKSQENALATVRDQRKQELQGQRDKRVKDLTTQLKVAGKLTTDNKGELDADAQALLDQVSSQADSAMNNAVRALDSDFNAQQIELMTTRDNATRGLESDLFSFQDGVRENRRSRMEKFNNAMLQQEQSVQREQRGEDVSIRREGRGEAQDIRGEQRGFQREDIESIQDIARDAAENGATSEEVQSILNAGSVNDALSVAAPFLKDPELTKAAASASGTVPPSDDPVFDALVNEYAQASTPAQRSNVFKRAEDAGYEGRDLISQASLATASPGQVINTKTGQPVNISDAFNKSIGGMDSIVSNTIPAITGIISGGKLQTGFGRSAEIAITPREDLTTEEIRFLNLIKDLESQIILIRSGAQASDEEVKRLRKMLPSFEFNAEGNLTQMKQFQETAIGMISKQLQAEGVSIAGSPNFDFREVNTSPKKDSGSSTEVDGKLSAEQQSIIDAAVQEAINNIDNQ